MSNDKRRHSKCCPNQNSNIRKISENWKFYSKYLRPKVDVIMLLTLTGNRTEIKKIKKNVFFLYGNPVLQNNCFFTVEFFSTIRFYSNKLYSIILIKTNISSIKRKSLSLKPEKLQTLQGCQTIIFNKI